MLNISIREFLEILFLGFVIDLIDGLSFLSGVFIEVPFDLFVLLVILLIDFEVFRENRIIGPVVIVKLSGFSLDFGMRLFC